MQQSMLQAIQVVLLAGGASIAPAIIGAVKDLLMGLLADKVTHSGISTTSTILTSAPGLRSHRAHICAGTDCGLTPPTSAPGLRLRHIDARSSRRTTRRAPRPRSRSAHSSASSTTVRRGAVDGAGPAWVDGAGPAPWMALGRRGKMALGRRGWS